ncbi:SOUL family heme-binding protein [Allochromatium vinosum]|uniref:SOUL heme-binding protein n=1 Tax=Allochromatium vinosum (strain ATCC 17899 / DSM 180 / NBRC 103801 / NCIMB 10441 / D) TaxID=572477 RepID=D3RUX8_ALLVD|nr:heme-binding protein [Allochromatium vinosum]ADC61027.1 SOUL heme-binding protein [Allochromatium vinosum DSM 180]
MTTSKTWTARAWLGAVLLLSGAFAMATEEPRYQILKTTEDYELRDYEPYRVAEVEVRGAFEEVGSQAFRILAGYIFGDNQGEAKIAMTAPVSQRPGEMSSGADPGAGTRLEMTAPVTQRPAAAESDTYVISFAMPESFTLEALPRPNNPRIRLREEPAGRVAARRYSGSWSESRYRDEERRLLDALQRDGLQPHGVPIYARYNGPFSLPMLRRNEILVPLAGSPDS